MVACLQDELVGDDEPVDDHDGAGDVREVVLLPKEERHARHLLPRAVGESARLDFEGHPTIEQTKQ